MSCPTVIKSLILKATEVIHILTSESLFSQILTSSCGWCVLEAAPTVGPTSRRVTTTLPRESSGWTRRDLRPCSTASCTRCATTDSDLCTQKEVSRAV